jgi:hypothetical protein
MSIFLLPYSLMAGIHRVFDMALDKFSMLIVDLLPETYCVLVRIDLFEISGCPASASLQFIPVTTSTTGKLFPSAKLALILSPFPLVCRHKS